MYTKLLLTLQDATSYDTIKYDKSSSYNLKYLLIQNELVTLDTEKRTYDMLYHMTVGLGKILYHVLKSINH